MEKLGIRSKMRLHLCLLVLCLVNISISANIPISEELEELDNFETNLNTFDDAWNTDDDHAELESEDEDETASEMLSEHRVVVLDSNAYMEEMDEFFVFETANWLEEKAEGEVESKRQRRWVTLAARGVTWAARALFRSSIRGRLTQSGTRITQQYMKSGTYRDTVRDFRSFQPQGVQAFHNGNIRGMSGQVGRYRITARDGSSGGAPTLEIRGGRAVRKFRYQQQ